MRSERLTGQPFRSFWLMRDAMTTYEHVSRMAAQLSLAEKARLIETLSALLRRELEIEAFRRMPWHEFIERTAGSLADDPIERPPQLQLEEREPLE
jgi:hypothetical protein